MANRPLAERECVYVQADKARKGVILEIDNVRQRAFVAYLTSTDRTTGPYADTSGEG